MTAPRNPYLDWTPLAHGPSCRSVGWDVRTAQYDETIAARAVCTGCGSSYELTAPSGDNGAVLQMSSQSYAEGHLARPLRTSSVWMHGLGAAQESRPHSNSRYASYYVTRSKLPPADPAEVLGFVNARQTPNGTVWWGAALARCDDTSSPNQLRPGVSAEREFSSPGAAARWVERAGEER